jgi:hypothetical protein
VHGVRLTLSAAKDLFTVRRWTGGRSHSAGSYRMPGLWRHWIWRANASQPRARPEHELMKKKTKPNLACFCGATARDNSKERNRFRRRHLDIPPERHKEVLRLRHIRDHKLEE